MLKRQDRKRKVSKEKDKKSKDRKGMLEKGKDRINSKDHRQDSIGKAR